MSNQGKVYDEGEEEEADEESDTEVPDAEEADEADDVDEANEIDDQEEADDNDAEGEAEAEAEGEGEADEPEADEPEADEPEADDAESPSSSELSSPSSSAEEDEEEDIVMQDELILMARAGKKETKVQDTLIDKVTSMLIFRGGTIQEDGMRLSPTLMKHVEVVRAQVGKTGEKDLLALVCKAAEKIGIALVRVLIGCGDEFKGKDVILIGRAPMTSSAKKTLQMSLPTVIFFLEKDLISLTRFSMIPKHRLATEEEKKRIPDDVSKYPKMMATDAAAKIHGFRAGQVVAIERKWGFGIEDHVFYRLVI